LRRLAATDHDAGNEAARQGKRTTERTANVSHEPLTRCRELPQIEVRA
jgi:hypothetical protein